MAEIIGLIASVITVAETVLSSSRALYEMVKEIRNAPEELAAIREDMGSFKDVVHSVQLAIRDRLVVKALLGDKELCELVVRLEAPLQNCSTILDQLRRRIQRHLKSTSDGKSRFSSMDFRWLFEKKDIIDCRSRLEGTKTTLDAKLTSIIFFCSLRSAGHDAGIVPSKEASRISRDLDAGSALIEYGEYAESIAPRSPLDAVSNIYQVELPIKFDDKSADLDAEAARSSCSDLASTTYTARDDGDNTALAIAITEGHDETAIALIQRQSILTERSDFCFPPLQCAIRYKRPIIVEALIARGRQLGQLQVMLNTREHAGRLPLTLASWGGSIQIASQLLDAGADINERDSGGWTPLMWAACWGQMHMVEFLIEKRADCQARNAVNKDYLEILKFHNPRKYREYVGQGNS